MEEDPVNILDHQDWKTLIVKKTKEKPDKNKPKITKVGDPNVKMEKKIEEGKLEHKKITNELRVQIQQGRASKGLTQKQLANSVNLPQSIINEIESGKAIYNHVHINKIKRVLGIKK
jgi:ribosome-binding protein aMBF1 (putative translation factor)|tara:strand:- start:374 stop:724 length:351 start_codon:yes stop_codon:yes gene_type:complete